MASDMKILFVFNFETGDASCSWWQEIAVVYGSNEDIKTIEDGFCSYFESTACEDKNYDEIVEDVLNSLPKDIKTIDSSAFSNSMENLTIYGEAQSAAAHYASENLLDFVVLGKNEFKNVASAATATEKMTIGDSVESDRWKISFNAAYSLRGSFNYTTSGKQKEKTLQNGNELIVLCYSVKNISGSDQEFNFLDVSAKVNGYTHKISSYGSIGYSQLAQYDRLLVGKVKSGEILYGYIAIETTAGWKDASVQFLNDTSLESYSFDIKADSKDITYIGSANDPAENAQASETVPAEIQTTEPITETETEATSLKQS